LTSYVTENTYENIEVLIVSILHFRFKHTELEIGMSSW